MYSVWEHIHNEKKNRLETYFRISKNEEKDQLNKQIRIDIESSLKGALKRVLMPKILQFVFFGFTKIMNLKQ